VFNVGTILLLCDNVWGHYLCKVTICLKFQRQFWFLMSMSREKYCVVWHVEMSQFLASCPDFVLFECTLNVRVISTNHFCIFSPSLLLAADLRSLEFFHIRCQQQISGICWSTSAAWLSHHIPVLHQLASKLLAVTSQSLAILPDWVTSLSPPWSPCPRRPITWSPTWLGLEAPSWSTKQQMGRSGS